MSRIITALALLCLVRSAPGQDLVLVENKASTYRIVIGVDATAQEAYAADLLQQHVEQMTGCKLPVVSDERRPIDTEIVIGFNRRLDRLGLELTRGSFGREGFLIRTIGPTLVIVGGSPRGVPYGVNSLLTDEWGCRWFTPQLQRIPRRERLTLPPTDRRYEPPFEWRNAFFWSGIDPGWAFHNHQHKRFAPLRPEQGWNGALASDHAHTGHTLVPPDKYLEDHPDWFWEGREDENRSNEWARDRGWVGFCLTNADVTRTAARNLLADRDPRNGGGQFYVVSAMDYGDWCECENCRAWHRRELGRALPDDAGHWPHGALWLDFAARVHELIKEEPGAPGVMLLAYGYAPEPPARAAGHGDLGVFYAELSVDQLHTLGSPSNALFQRRLGGWQQSVGTVYVWLYKNNFFNWSLVHPNMHTFGEDLRYLRAVGVKGVFAQGNQMAYWGQRFAGEMNELRAYLLARLLWNPDLDWRAERRDFCAAYYGEAAGAVIEQYLDDLHEAFAVQGVRSNSGVEPDKLRWISPERFVRWYGYMDRAHDLAEDEPHKELVRIARLPIQLTEAMIVADEARRKTMLQAYLDEARSLGAAQIINENLACETWARGLGLAWK